MALCAIIALGFGIWIRTDSETSSFQIASAKTEQLNLLTVVASKPRASNPSQRATTSFAHEVDATRLPNVPVPKQDNAASALKPSVEVPATESIERVETTPNVPKPIEVPKSDEPQPEPREAETPPAIDSTAKAQPLEPLKESPLANKGKALLDEPATCGADRKLGTSLVWAETADEASDLAQQQNKLVYLIQVSGNFEIEEFT